MADLPERRIALLTPAATAKALQRFKEEGSDWARSASREGGWRTARHQGRPWLASVVRAVCEACCRGRVNYAWAEDPGASAPGPPTPSVSCFMGLAPEVPGSPSTGASPGPPGVPKRIMVWAA